MYVYHLFVYYNLHGVWIVTEPERPANSQHLDLFKF